MKLKNRFTLVGIGIIIFLILTPMLVLYARGFKIDWKNYKIIKTGVIVVRTEPTKAFVFLNNKLEKSQTPASIRFISAGDYEIRIKKDGYQAWSKRLAVRPQLVTWANDNRPYVALFLETARLEHSWPASLTAISSSSDEIAILSDGKIIALDIDSSNTSVFSSSIPTQLLPLAQNFKLAWQNASEVFNLAKSRNWLLTDLEIASIKSIETDGRMAIGILNTDLFQLNTGAARLIDKSVDSFKLDGNNLWYIQQGSLIRLNLSNNSKQTITDSLPKSATSQIIRADNQIYLILDQNLYVLNGQLEKIYSPVSAAYWDTEARVVVYSNDNEISIYHPQSKNTDLVLRSLSAIKNPRLNAETGYMFFANENKIKAIELDTRDHQNIYTIIETTDSDGKFALSTNGKKLYILSPNEIMEYIIR